LNAKGVVVEIFQYVVRLDLMKNTSFRPCWGAIWNFRYKHLIFW